MKVVKIILCLCMFLFPLEGREKKYAIVNLMPIHNTGLFSIFCYVAGVLDHYEKQHAYCGMEVDFADRGIYYEPIYGLNSWEYYCQPIKLGTKSTATKIKSFNQNDYCTLATKIVYTDRHRVKEIIDRYIKIKPHIVEKVEQFYHSYLAGVPLICVHYRGTDKNISEAPRISYKRMKEEVERYILEHQLQEYTLFIASDEEQFVHDMAEYFPGKVQVYYSERSSSDLPIHTNTQHPYQQGEDALVDCLLLSKGDVLIRTSSNLSLWSGFFNPELPVIFIHSH